MAVSSTASYPTTVYRTDIEMTSAHDSASSADAMDFVSNQNLTSPPSPNATCTEDSEEHVLHIVTFVGASVSILGILLTLLSYIGFRKFRVKRTHIVMVNLCICLLLYFIGYLFGNAHRQHSGNCHGNINNPLCIAGAFIAHFAMLSTWFWITAYWFVLLVMFQRPMGGHISFFFAKAAIPSYGFSFTIALVCILVAQSSDGKYFNDMCLVDDSYLYYGLLLPFAVAFIPIFSIFVYVLRGTLATRSSGPLQRIGNIGRVKVHLIKLSVITILIAIMILGSVIVPAIKEGGDSQHNLISVIVFTVFSAALGVLLLVLFCLHQEEIRRHWLQVLSGKKHPIHHTSLSRKKHDGLGGSIGSNRKSSTLTNRQPSLFVDPPEDESSRKSSKIIPKEDTDMTTLGLIQIPGTPSPNRNSLKQEGGLQAIDEHTQMKACNNGKSERSSLLVKLTEEKKRRNDSASSTSSTKGKTKKSKRQKSHDHLLVDKADRKKEFKRRSFSSSSITDGLHMSKKKRESTISNDSTPVTNFL